MTAADVTPAASPGADRSTPSLVLDRVSRNFGGLSAVSDFSLSLGRGDLFGLIGPNGAGKTTVFNVITGVYPPSAGEIRMDGRRIEGSQPVQICRTGIARTFQNIRLFQNLSVLDNVVVAFNRPAGHGLFRTVLRTPRCARELEAAESDGMELLRTLRLDDKAHFIARHLPYGDQRRLEIARALATGPKILLLDEPAAGMNPQEKADLMGLIRFIRDRFGVGILLIEHDMKLVMSICERVTVLDHGETISVGTPAEVQCNPDVIEAYLGEPAPESETRCS
jgi:branched-chain amino acid transport system ATP-binding protein